MVLMKRVDREMRGEKEWQAGQREVSPGSFVVLIGGEGSLQLSVREAVDDFGADREGEHVQRDGQLF